MHMTCASKYPYEIYTAHEWDKFPEGQNTGTSLSRRVYVIALWAGSQSETRFYSGQTCASIYHQRRCLFVKRTLLLISGLILALVLVACGGNDNNNDNNDNDMNNNNTEEPANNNENDNNNNDDNNNNTTDASAAEDVYKQNCASCHGDDLKGENGPSLEAVGNDMSEDEIRDQIEEGGDGMPGGLIDGDEADQVAAWLADQK